MGEGTLHLWGEEILYRFTLYCRELEANEIDYFIEERNTELEDVYRKLSSGEFSYFDYNFKVHRFDPEKQGQNGELLYIMAVSGAHYVLRDIKGISKSFREDYIKMFNVVRQKLGNENGPINASMYVRGWKEGIYTPAKGRINIFGEKEESV